MANGRSLSKYSEILGIAFAVVILLIYILIVGWFQNFTVPLVMLAAIPLSLIGIVLGHWMLGAYFTATSMIGFHSTGRSNGPKLGVAD